MVHVLKRTVEIISPYGGELVNLCVEKDESALLKEQSTEYESVILSDRSLCDFELLATGAFSPLKTFMNQADYESVLENMRLSDGTLFPMPITLPVDRKYETGKKLALRDEYGNLLAVMTVEDAYEWDPEFLAEKLLGSNDEAHNLVRELKTWGRFNVSGKLQAVALPVHKDFRQFRFTPAQTRRKLTEIGNENVVAFQTRNPLHRAHEELTKRAASKIEGTLLLHPAVGMTKPGDVDHTTRVRCYMALLDNHYDGYEAMLSLLPLAMRMAGPREALWHAIIRRNYGANHFIVGRDHAGPGKKSNGEMFYQPYASQELVKKHENELGMTILTFNEMMYLVEEDRYVEAHEVLEGDRTMSISGTQVREEYLAKGKQLPEWFTRPEVAAVLADAYKASKDQGFCLWFTGLSGAGKSTIAQAVEAALHEVGRRTTMLDGDVVRNMLSKGLGFSKEDREANIERVGFVASQVVYHHGVAICALISPYENSRRKVRELFSEGNFIEVYVSTPLEVCEARDPKGHYVKNRQGKMKNFTGVDATYEVPENPDIVIDSSKESIEESVELILSELCVRGLVA